MEHLINFLRGLSSGVTLAPPPRGYRVDAFGFHADAANMWRDFSATGRDMRCVVKRDQQAYERAREGQQGR